MIEPKVVRFSSAELQKLRLRFEKLDEVTEFREDLKFAATIACLGIAREVGTVNDELARFIFNADTAMPLELAALKADLVEWGGLSGVRVRVTGAPRLELRTAGFYDVVHPALSANADGTLHSLYIFPEIVQRVAAAEGVDLVLVKSWGMNSIFGGFDPAKAYYQTNFWEIENNDALKFADLVRQRKAAFLGTHDLIAHIAGVRQKDWELLQSQAERVYQAIRSYFTSTTRPTIAALILPYTLGVVLDDLAQPPSYGSASHEAVLESLLSALAARVIPANLPTVLARFPQSFQQVIELSRTQGIENSPEKIRRAIENLVQEILRASLVTAV